ncbi:pentapeptide repeat-containing protein [Brevundimonas balnearis]|uniref:Pentapeptide repeat-containing protein n=1 Tax=Brevundimonas balnearis TaxID=1572858 RepID=A0ABV6R0V7_9CAUL
MIPFEIRNRWTNEVQVIAKIDCAPDAPVSIKLGLAVRWAVKAKANLSEANLSGANLSEADLSGAYLRGANLSGAYLSRAYLSEADLSRADLSRADLRGANLRRADLREADLSRADLRGANLRGAYLSRADLRGANLRGAYLSRAYLSEADLSRADLSEAYLSRANLSRADLREANLRGAKNLDDMIMPDGLTFAQYKRDVVPALLTAGGKTLDDIRAAGAWDCHDWSNCPMHVAFGVNSTSEMTGKFAIYRTRADEFIRLFDARLIPAPWEPAAEPEAA